MAASITELFGNILGKPDTYNEDRAAQAALDASINAYNIPLPDLQGYAPEDYGYAGDFKAAQVGPAQAIQAGPDTQFKGIDPQLAALTEMSGTAYDNINVDPRFQNEQMASLDALRGIADGGGFTAADKANLNRVQNDVAQQDRGRRDAILQGMQARGMSGGGQELLAQLQSSQAATDRASQQGLDIAGMAQQRALDALMQGGQLAGQMGSQQFGEQAQLAAARDAISQFNTKNANQMSQFNAGTQNDMGQFNAQSQLANSQYNRNTGIDVAAKNAANTMGVQQANAGFAQQAGLANKDARQGVANLGTQGRNDAKQANAQLPQQQFQNATTLASGKSGAQQGAVGHYQTQADQKIKRDAAIKDALIKGGITAATAGK